MTIVVTWGLSHLSGQLSSSLWTCSNPTLDRPLKGQRDLTTWCLAPLPAGGGKFWEHDPLMSPG